VTIMRKWISTIVLRYWRVLTAIVTLQLLYALLSVLQPIFYQRIISLAIVGDALMMKDGLPIILQLVGIYLGCTLLQAAGGYCGCSFSSNLLEHLQTDFFHKTSHLPLAYFQHEPQGELFTKFNNDIGQAQRFFSHSVPALAREAFTSLVIAIILISLYPALLIAMTVCILLATAIPMVRLNGIMAHCAMIQRKEWGQINKVFEETLAGIETFKMFADEARRGAALQQRTIAFRNLSIKAGRWVAVFSPGIDLISKIGSLILIVVAYWLLSTHKLRVDDFLLFFFYSALLQGSMAQLVNVIAGIQPELAGVGNLSGFFITLGLEDNIENDKGEQLTEAVAIDIAGLTFAYPGNAPLYQDADIDIPAKAVTIVQGPSGSGKSTLINILLRFCQPQMASIHIGDDVIEQFPTQALRKGIGVVAHHHYIFNESLRENLLVANPEATDAQLRQAIDTAQLSNLVRRLKGGLDEVLDPGGRGLSAGEKQRLCIARLLVKKAPIMILDEPWTNIDKDAREKLVRVINTCRKTTTILILTHAVHPSLKVDRQYVLDPGKGKFILSPTPPLRSRWQH
jgi:ABC-type multidrug transport system fused ATPase/permease subunit